MRRFSITGTSGSPRRPTLAGIDGYRKRLGAVEFDYLAACQEAERLARRRTRRVQALVGVLVAAIVAGLVAWQYEQPLTGAHQLVHAMRPYMSQCGPTCLRRRRAGAEAEGRFQGVRQDCPEMIVVPAGEFHDGLARDRKGPHER